MGSSTENSAFGPTKNPLDPTASRADRPAVRRRPWRRASFAIALGSETGGSVRQPAAFCGVVGVKPTYGRVSRYGLVAFASSLDQIGVFGRTVDDAAIGLEAIAGLDPLDSTSAAEPRADYRDAARGSLTGVVIGRPREYFPADLDPRIRERCDAALDMLRRSAPRCATSRCRTRVWRFRCTTSSPRRRRRPTSRASTVCGMGCASKATGCARCTRPRARAASAREVTRRILLGTYVLSAGYYDAYYRKAQQVRALIARDFAERLRGGVASALHAHHADARVPARRQVRSVRDVSERHLHLHGEPRRCAGDVAADRPRRRAAGRRPAHASHFDERQMFVAAYALERALAPERLTDVQRTGAHDRYEMVVGLEVHVQLKTATKIFCGCSADFGGAAELAHLSGVSWRCPARSRCSTTAPSISRSARLSRSAAPSSRRPSSRARTISIRTCRRATRSRNSTSRSPRKAA